jgi:hypothetical protein
VFHVIEEHQHWALRGHLQEELTTLAHRRRDDFSRDPEGSQEGARDVGHTVESGSNSRNGLRRAERRLPLALDEPRPKPLLPLIVLRWSRSTGALNASGVDAAVRT